MAAAVERLLAPADAVRAALLRRLGRVAGVWSSDRALRVSVLFAFATVTSLAGALVLPLWLLALGPVLLGVPHVVADVRYLVMRRGLHRRLLILAPVLVALSLGLATSRLVWAAGAMAAVALLAKGSRPRRALVLAAAAAFGLVCFAAPGRVELAFAHLHNLIAVLIWWLLRPRRVEWLPLGLYALAGGLILLGAFDALWLEGLSHRLGPSPGYHLSVLAPAELGAYGLRLVVFFAFAQAVHYAVWLRLIPEDDRERTAPRGFRSSYRALLADLGAPLLVLSALAALAIVGWALFDLIDARAGYLRLAVAHGHLELAVLALFVVEGGAARARAGRPSSAQR